MDSTRRNWHGDSASNNRNRIIIQHYNESCLHTLKMYDLLVTVLCSLQMSSCKIFLCDGYCYASFAAVETTVWRLSHRPGSRGWGLAEPALTVLPGSAPCLLNAGKLLALLHVRPPAIAQTTWAPKRKYILGIVGSHCTSRCIRGLKLRVAVLSVDGARESCQQPCVFR